MDLKKLRTKPKEKRLDLLFKAFGKQLFLYGNKQWNIPKDACWELVYACLYKVEEVLEDVSFESEKKFQSYVFRIFINRMKNYLRDEKTKKRGNTEVEFDEERIEKPEKKVEEEGKEIQVLNALLDELEDWQRILMLMRAQDYSYAEISKYTNQSEKNLKVYYGRLKKRIAKEMELKLQNEIDHGE